jgi:trehalose-6-phosphate synthase
MLQGVELDSAEPKRRMQRMQQAVRENSVYRWAGKIPSTLLGFDFPESTE